MQLFYMCRKVWSFNGFKSLRMHVFACVCMGSQWDQEFLTIPISEFQITVSKFFKIQKYKA